MWRKSMVNIDISNLDKAAILAALYNAASPTGMGFIRAIEFPGEMTIEQAREILQETQHFDYLGGRSFKIDLSSNDFDPWLYDRDNGGDGTAERIIESVRQTGAVASSEIKHNREVMTAERAYQQPEYAEIGDAVAAIVSEFQEMVSKLQLPEPPTGLTPRQHLDWASDQALKFFNEDPKKSVVAFLILIEANPAIAWIVTHPATLMILQIGMQSRYEMERAMKGFAA